MKSEIKVTPLLLPSFLPTIRLSIQLLMQQKNEMYKCKREPFQLENCYLVETWMREREREKAIVREEELNRSHGRFVHEWSSSSSSK